jgi:hypothetical protein
MAKHAEGVPLQPKSTLILILTRLQMTLPRAPLRRRMPLPLVLLPTRQRSQGAPELRMPRWDGSDAWQLDCVSFGGAPGARVQRWLADGM